MKTKSYDLQVKPVKGGLIRNILLIMILCLIAVLVFGQEFSPDKTACTSANAGKLNSFEDSPGDEFSMHWPQMPKPDGWDIGFAGSKLADDFLCTSSGHINHVRFWISFKNDSVQEINHFRLSFCDNYIMEKSNMPGMELWDSTYQAGEFTLNPMSELLQGWFDPATQQWITNNHQKWYEITVVRSDTLFLPEMGNLYWLLLDFGELQNIGWKESEGPHFNSPCLYQSELSGSWIPVMYDQAEDSVPVDLAFVLSEEEIPNLEVIAMPDTVCAGDTVQLQAMVSGDAGNYQLTWFSIPGDFLDTNNNFNPVVTPFRPTTYYAVLSDGMIWMADSVKVFVPGISCPAGWSGISSYIDPFNAEMETVLNPILNDLIILKNLSEMYYPGGSIFTLENWDAYSGYVIKVTNKTYLPICGYEVQDKTVNLDEGWNLIPVLSNEPYNIETLFNDVDSLVIVKDAVGTGIYWKDYEINTIVDVLPGKAYYVKMDAPDSINFSMPSGKSALAKPSISKVLTSPWNTVISTPFSHLVAFVCSENPFLSGDIVGGFTSDGRCAGFNEIEDPDSPFAISLCGDDVFSLEKDGFEAGEILNYKLYRPNTGQMFDLAVTYNPEKNPGIFVNNGLSEVTSVKTVTTGFGGKVAENFNIYPNPSPGTFTIEGNGSIIKITIYNTFGEEICFNELTLPAKVDLSTQPKGIYFIRIETDKNMFFEKLIKD